MDYLNLQPDVKFHCLHRQEPLRLLKARIRRQHAAVYRVLQRKRFQVHLV
jgi:hypothetical protein